MELSVVWLIIFQFLKKFNYKNIILTHKNYEYLYDILEIIEEPFHIRFSDSDIASFDYDYQEI